MSDAATIPDDLTPAPGVLSQLAGTDKLDGDVQDLDNGDAIVTLDDEEPEATPEQERDHFANIVEEVDQLTLATSVEEILDLIEKDKESRKKRDKQYEEALQRTGLGNDAPGGAQFSGASRVVHPGLTEASIDFASRVIKEIFPASGPCKEKIIGEVSAAKFKKAERKKTYMNWQLTQQMRSFRAELEQLLPQAALSGVAYLKLVYNENRKRPDPIWIPEDEILLPYAATNFYTAERVTHVQDVTEFEYRRRVKSGMYIDADLTVSAQVPETTAAAKANAKIEGKEESAYNEDGLRRFFEVACWLEIEDDVDGEAPYIITIDKQQRRAVALYRNWDIGDDEAKEALNWIVEFPFVPWRGAYPIGLIHMIGGLSAATTGSLRALLDSAHINNAATAMKMKGGNRGGQSVTISPTQVTEIEGSIQTDDIRKTFMPLPFNPPSPVLFQLMGFLVEAQNGVVRTTYEDLAENSTNMPVGTVQALIEQGMVVFSAIHARMHDAMGRVLELLHRINKMYLTDQEVVEELGELVVSRRDFEGPLDVVPVSDPNIFSEVQRMAQMQMIVARSDLHPGLYDPYAVEKMVLDRTKVPDATRLLKEPPKPTELNAVNENLAATMGRPVVVFPEQDHLAHLKVHFEYMLSPIFGQNPLVAPTFLPAIMNHLRDHLAFWYVTQAYDMTSEAVGGDVSNYMGKDPEVNKAMDDLLATASPQILLKASQTFGSIPSIISQVQQFMRQFQPPPPMDPTQAAMAAVNAQAKTNSEKNQITAQGQQQKTALSGAQLQAQQAKDAQDAALKQAEIEAENQRAAAELNEKQQDSLRDSQTALTIATMDALSGHKAAVEDGNGIHPGT